MTLTLDIEKLQAVNTCRDGQVNFRRKFTRSKTWYTLEAFELDMHKHHALWSWDEACEKFEIDQDEWRALTNSLLNIKPEDDETDDEEEGHGSGYSRREACAVAWARLYWAQQHPTYDTIVPAAARDYIAAVEKLESAFKFKSQHLTVESLRPSVDFDGYYKGNSEPIKEFIAKKIKTDMKDLIDAAVIEFEKEVELKRLALARLMTEKTPNKEVQPAASAA